MRYAIIENGTVTNIAVSDAPLTDNWIASDIAQINDRYVDGGFMSSSGDDSAQWSAIRSERNAKLAVSDWTQLPDAPVDASVWASYRQALRDITQQSDPFDIIWPTAPDGE